MTTTVKGTLADAGKTFKDPDIATIGLQIEDPQRLATGLFAFDLATGGGFPLGRVSILYGKEDSMKTTLYLKAIATAQRLYPKKTAVFVDVEGVIGKKWAQQMGVDVKKLGYVNPDNAEQMVDIVSELMYAEDVSVIVIDSLAALITQHELDKSAEDAIVGKSGMIELVTPVLRYRWLILVVCWLAPRYPFRAQPRARGNGSWQRSAGDRPRRPRG